jgi:tRNA pseudouridine55 synthase
MNFMAETPDSGALIVDKPPGITSHGVIARLRHCLPGVKMGHGGTLDPMATGVLPIFLNRATRLAQFFLHSDKEYAGVIRFGWATDTNDREGKPLAAPRPAAFDRQALEEWIDRFRGEITQAPPAYSAVKWQGRPLYHYARQGKTAPRRERRIRVDALELLAWEPPDLHFRLACSGGTYVRTIAHELGELAGCGAHLHALRRTRLGQFRLEHATGLDELTAAPTKVAARVLPPELLLDDLPAWPCAPDTVERVRNGVELPLPDDAGHPDGTHLRLLDGAGRVVAVGRVRTVAEGRRVIRPAIVLT